MGVRNVFKVVIFMFFFLNIIKLTGQEAKYLMFNNEKDSIVCKGSKRYFKIDKNLFDTSRFQEIDTLNSAKVNDFSFNTVEELWSEANMRIDKMIQKEKREKTGVIQIIETYNEIFECIYIVQRVSKDKYIRVRVWWIDY